MKISPAIALALFILSAPVAAEDGRYLLVHSAHAPVNASGCPQKVLHMDSFDTEEVARAEGRRLRAERQLTDHSSDILLPGRYSVVYKFESRSSMYANDCVFTKYAVMTGDDADDVKERLDRHVSEYQHYFLSSPSIVRVWTGGGLRKVRRDYDGVEATYLTARSGDKTTVHAQVRNTRPDQKALVRFRVNGVLQPKAIELQPGQSANVPLGRDVRHFGAGVQFASPDQPATPSLRKRAEDVLREQITIKDGTIAVDPACNCIRG